jgi:acetylornithine aminotransferase/acetylornithine/N-succinyldiaminopimelate aminotransferase
LAYQNYGIQPDLVTVAKPIAGGLPLGALLATEKVAGCIHPGMHGTTFGGGPLACAVALQLIAVMEKEKMLKHVRKVGEHFMEQLQKLQKKRSSIVEVRGQGLMIGMELESADAAKQVFQQMLKLGTIVNRTDETVIRFLPPFIIKKQHIDTALQQLDQILAQNTKTAAIAGRNK